MKNRFGSYLKQHRMLAQLSVEDLARQVGCDPHLVRRVEMNVNEIPGEFLVAWSNCLGMDANEIILLFVNEKVREMCLDARLALLFKIIPADWEGDLHERHIPRHSNPRRSVELG